MIFVGGLKIEQVQHSVQMNNIELDVLTCQNGNCAWSAAGVSLATPRYFGLAMVVPELMACQADTGVVGYTTPAGPPGCNLGWIADGFCDDGNNHMDCSYDGGDCCGIYVNTAYCQVCNCLDPYGECSIPVGCSSGCLSELIHQLYC